MTIAVDVAGRLQSTGRPCSRTDRKCLVGLVLAACIQHTPTPKSSHCVCDVVCSARPTDAQFMIRQQHCVASSSSSMHAAAASSLPSGLRSVGISPAIVRRLAGDGSTHAVAGVADSAAAAAAVVGARCFYGESR